MNKLNLSNYKTNCCIYYTKLKLLGAIFIIKFYAFYSVGAYKYIVIEGGIGVGKTTLSQHLSKTTQAQCFLELVEENPFLVNGFYQNMEANAFNTELFFLLARFRQQRQISEHLQSDTTPVVSDYLFQKNAIFASLTLKPEDYQIFSSVFTALKPHIPHPDLVVYLKSDVNTLIKRIRLRDRKFERDIQASYLHQLIEKYDTFFKTFTEAPVITVDATSLDFVKRPKDYEHILNTIQ